jgi:hypothetical protein
MAMADAKEMKVGALQHFPHANAVMLTLTQLNNTAQLKTV